jgi:hypothetical protein
MIGKATRTALLVVVASFVASSAEAESAEVFKFDPGVCFFGWTDGINFIGLPGEMGIGVETNNGKDTLLLVCHGQVPDDGSVPPVDVVLPLFGFDGAGIFNFENTGEVCNVGGILTADFQQVVSPSGRVNLVCKVHP